MLDLRLDSWLSALSITLDADQRMHLERFAEELYRVNAYSNLTRISEEEFGLRHFLDSVLFHDLIPEASSVLDIGTGPGFPAWPLALVRPDLRVTGLDSSGKMLGFLRSQPLPNLTIVEARAEDWDVREAFDVVTGRALAPLPIQLELSAASCRVGGVVIPMRTESDMETISSLNPERVGLKFERSETRVLPVIDASRVFPIYRKVSPTPKNFPRKWAEIRNKPIG
ncbi:MAG: 16S rRNA (guanine(527)-N(7))-methyltransferase RsmG [Fimbriimonadaceae bacterium]|nr:16S rRNA (guanine(527)-N(7))-methyltransferase RsmG [Fimbriimonadaceae bacterium]